MAMNHISDHSIVIFFNRLPGSMARAVWGSHWREPLQKLNVAIQTTTAKRYKFAVVVLLSALSSVAQSAFSQFTLMSVGDGYCATNQVNGLSCAVAVEGNYAYLANNEDGLRIINVANPAAPREVWHFPNPYAVGAHAHDVYISGEYAYLANGFDGLRVFNIADPENAASIGQIYPGGFAVGVTVRGDYAYLASSDGGLNILDISDRANPHPVAQTNNGGNACSVALSGSYAFLANLSDGLRVYDVSHPGAPSNIAHTNINTSPSTVKDATDVKVFGQFAYVAQGGFQIFDVSTPSAPLWTNGVSFGSSVVSVDVSGDGNYALLGCYPQGLYLCDVSSPCHIQVVGHSYHPEFIYDVTFHGNYVYVADGQRGMRIYLAVPQLAIGLTSTNSVLISWPQPLAHGFTLQHNSNLSLTTWVDVANVPTVAGNRCQIVVSAKGVQEFFRLRFVQ